MPSSARWSDSWQSSAVYRDFGKGSGHPAQPNYADCFSYALAIDRGEPLLFMGEDFGHTDVGVASW